jgi:prophage pi1 protein 08
MITRSNERERKEKVMAQRFEIFNKENLGSIRTAVVNGEPWFCLKDACDILGIKNHKDLRKRLNPKGVDSIDTLTKGGKQALLYVDEPNLYKAIMQSRKKEAEVFSDWIFYEVIPSIRKHGYYSNIPQINEKDVAMLSIIKAGSEEERSIAFSKYQERFVLPMQKELEMARPKVEMYNEFLDAEGTANITTIAKSFGLSSGRLLNEIMHFEGFIVKIGNGWGPAKKYVNEGIMKPIEFSYNNRKNQQELKETNDNEILLLENRTDEMAKTTELTVIEEENKANHQGKGLTFRWTLTGIGTIKEVLLSENYIVKNGNVYSGNNETLKKFKKKYKEWKEKK